MSLELSAKKTVKKSNVLNELRDANTSKAEYRLFCVYLAHLPMNSEDNKVTFKLADYTRIVGLDRPRRDDLEEQAKNIVSKTAKLAINEPGEFEVVPIFRRFKLTHEPDGWYVTLECNEELAPLIREQKGHFLRYKLYNTIYLKSFNQQRIYELLKQYERVGVRIIDLKDLREYLSIEEHEYPVWYNFSRDVLKVAQKALKEYTDICFEYEPIKRGRPVVAVKFTITKNEGYIDQLGMDEVLPPEEIDYDGDDFEIDGSIAEFEAAAEESEDPGIEESDPSEENLFAGACPEGFTAEEIEAIRVAAWDKVPFELNAAVPHDIRVYDYIAKKVALMKANKDPVIHPFKWLFKAVTEDYR